MSISTILFVPNTAIVNKTIVYSDTVLPLKDVGNNLIITSIENVSEHSLESCLKIIFQSNPNVIFNTIQYSKQDKKIYFYTNQEITIKEYEDNRFATYKPINSHSEILEEVKKLLASDPIQDDDCISLYSIANLMFQMNRKGQTIEDYYNRKLNPLIKALFDSSSSIVIYDFDYENHELTIGFSYSGSDWNDITFAKNGRDLYISKSESCWDQKILAAIGIELSKIYDKFMTLSACHEEINYYINPVNSNFLVNALC